MHAGLINLDVLRRTIRHTLKSYMFLKWSNLTMLNSQVAELVDALVEESEIDS